MKSSTVGMAMSCQHEIHTHAALFHFISHLFLRKHPQRDGFEMEDFDSIEVELHRNSLRETGT